MRCGAREMRMGGERKGQRGGRGESGDERTHSLAAVAGGTGKAPAGASDIFWIKRGWWTSWRRADDDGGEMEAASQPRQQRSLSEPTGRRHAALTSQGRLLDEAGERENAVITTVDLLGGL